MSAELLAEFINYLEQTYNIQFKFKDESKNQQFFGWLAKPFNDRYLTHYVTNIDGTIWFPSQEWYDDQSSSKILRILLHEFIHIWDRQHAKKGWFNFSYAMFPWWRRHWEKRGYTATFLYWILKDGTVSDERREKYVQIFTGSDYGWMWPNAKKVKVWIDEVIKHPPTQEPFDLVRNYLEMLL